MRILREMPDDLHARLDLGVGLIDDAERRLAAPDHLQRRAHVSGLLELVLRRGPAAELLQRRLGVFTGRDREHIGYRDAAVAREPGDVEVLADGHIAELGL